MRHFAKKGQIYLDVRKTTSICFPRLLKRLLFLCILVTKHQTFIVMKASIRHRKTPPT